MRGLNDGLDKKESESSRSFSYPLHLHLSRGERNPRPTAGVLRQSPARGPRARVVRKGERRDQRGAGLARISHQSPAAIADRQAAQGVLAPRFSTYCSSMPASLVAAGALIRTPLSDFASALGEKCGLTRLRPEHVAEEFGGEPRFAPGTSPPRRVSSLVRRVRARLRPQALELERDASVSDELARELAAAPPSVAEPTVDAHPGSPVGARRANARSRSSSGGNPRPRRSTDTRSRSAAA